LFSDSKAVETYTLYAGVSAAVAGVCLFMIVGTNVEPSVAFLVAAVAVVVGLGAGVLAVVTALRRRSHLVLPALSLLAVGLAAAVFVEIVRQPRRPICPSHLRQIGMGLLLYAHDREATMSGHASGARDTGADQAGSAAMPG
jgi:hypothetical protein